MQYFEITSINKYSKEDISRTVMELRAFKFRLYPNKELEQKLAQVTMIVI